MILDFLAAHGAALKEVVADGSLVVATASAICAMTKTPDPSSVRGKIYRVIEGAALLVGEAKSVGIVPAPPAAAQKIADEVVSAAKFVEAPAPAQA